MKFLLKPTLLILLVTYLCQAEKLIPNSPVPLDTSLPVSQIDTYLTYYAILDLKDVGISPSKDSVKQRVLDGAYGEKAKEIFQKSRLENFKSVYTLLYASLHFKTKKDCDNRWVAVQWFITTGRKLGFTESELHNSEERITEFTLGVCDHLLSGGSLGELLKP